MKNQLLALALMTAGFVSCTDDSYDLDNISNDFRIGLNEYLPIASSEVKLKDILNEFKTDYFSEDPDDGTLIFEFDTVNRVYVEPIDVVFKESTYESDLVAENLVKISNNVIPADPNFVVHFPINLSVDDENGAGRIDEIHIKEGFLKFHIESDAFDAEALYIKNVNIPHDENILFNEETGTIKINLSNQILRFPEEGYVVTCEIATRSKYAGKDIPLTSKDVKIKVVMEESKLTYHKIKGSFKSNVEQIEYTDFYVNLYDDNMKHRLYVLDPKLNISGVTNCGIPLECSVKSLVAKHKTKIASEKDSIFAIFRKGTPLESKSFKFEDFKFADENKPEIDAFTELFDKQNGSLDEIFNYMPDSISVRCGIKIVGNDNDPKSQFFLLDSTYLDLNIRAEVPLHIGEGSYITIKDTVDGIDIVEDVTDYQDGNFKFDDVEIFLEFENELPLEGTVTAKFCRADSVNGKVVLTHIENTKLDQTVKIPAAQIDADGTVMKATPSKKKIKVTDDMVDDIKKINAVDFTYQIKVPKGTVNGVVLTKNCGMSAKVYSHLKANISNKEK